MTDLTASPAYEVVRAQVGFFLLASTALGISAMFAPEIGGAVAALATPCAPPHMAKTDLGTLLPKSFATLAAPNTVQPFFLKAANAQERDRAVRCLTNALYYEAANEPEPGQRAIAQVVVNRVRDKHFPKSVCGVVYEGWARGSGCQFSFVCDGSVRRRRADPAALERLRPLAEQALNGHVEPSVGTATHYYATYVRPNWRSSVAEVTGIGKHVFCSWKGKAGRPGALTGAYAGGELQVADAALDGRRPAKAAATRRSELRLARLARHEGRRRDRYA